MKKQLCLILALFCLQLYAQKPNPIENIIVITTDGLRWQEVFKGADSAIVEDDHFNQFRKSGIYERFGGKTAEERRRKLMPFFWSQFLKGGSIYGNRGYGNFVNVKNPYWFSYPGYSELFCGFVDTLINSNHYKPNPNTNVFEFINEQQKFKDKVAFFGEWDAFDNILNKKRSKFTIVCGLNAGPQTGDSTQSLLGRMKRESYLPMDTDLVQDVFVHYEAMDYLKKKKPHVMYISYGETDEWAHEGMYLNYLVAANRVDKWLGDIWNYIQHDPQYKDKTALLITVDHGRGDKEKKLWTSHKNTIAGSNEIWLGLICPGLPAMGEVKDKGQIYQQQMAETIAEILGLEFKCEHWVAPSIFKLKN